MALVCSCIALRTLDFLYNFLAVEVDNLISSSIDADEEEFRMIRTRSR